MLIGYLVVYLFYAEGGVLDHIEKKLVPTPEAACRFLRDVETSSSVHAVYGVFDGGYSTIEIKTNNVELVCEKRPKRKV